MIGRVGVLTVSVCLLAAAMVANGQAGAAGRGGKQAQQEPMQVATKQADPHEVVEKEILNELRQIRVLMERQQQQLQQTVMAAPAGIADLTQARAIEKARVSTAGFALGSKDAPITIVEFADYQCPFCRQFHSSVFARFKKDYIDTGKVRFVSRDLPLEFHTHAFAAAEAARCAGEQNKYWEMRDTLITHSDNLAPAAISAYAMELGVDRHRFDACVEKQTFSVSIRADVEEANSVGITGTPSFVIGPPSGDMVVGEKVVGAQSYEQLQQIISRYASIPALSNR